MAVGIYFPVVALTANTTVLPALRRRRPQTLLMVLALAIGGLTASLFVVTVLPTG